VGRLRRRVSLSCHPVAPAERGVGSCVNYAEPCNGCSRAQTVLREALAAIRRSTTASTPTRLTHALLRAPNPTGPAIFAPAGFPESWRGILRAGPRSRAGHTQRKGEVTSRMNERDYPHTATPAGSSTSHFALPIQRTPMLSVISLAEGG
jgi:hypothetical protein